MKDKEPKFDERRTIQRRKRKKGKEKRKKKECKPCVVLTGRKVGLKSG
jgi:hypothetical protein